RHAAGEQNDLSGVRIHVARSIERIDLIDRDIQARCQMRRWSIIRAIGIKAAQKPLVSAQAKFIQRFDAGVGERTITASQAHTQQEEQHRQSEARRYPESHRVFSIVLRQRMGTLYYPPS